MKKLFLLLAIVAIALPSCKKINEAIDGLDNRLDKLEQEAIPSIDEQIAAINVSLENLDAMDTELNGYIDGLQATADNLQEQINATNTKIDEVKAVLQSEISTAKADVLAELESLETELKNELAQINATIETLKAKDAELDQKITDLKTYVDTELGKTTDWVNATFATLTQYNALVAEVTAIKAQIVAINESIADLETRLTTKINEEIATAVSTLNSTIQQKVGEITDAYTNAVKTAKEELTAAYTAAIATAITNLETSLKAWVGEQLSNYYTIAEVDAKILTLQNSIKKGDEALQTQLDLLKEDLQTMKNELTTAYQKAIQDAITTNNGVINTKIANEIAAVNSRIDSEVATINEKIAELQARLDKVEARLVELEKLLQRIQSISYIPTYSDGKATVKYVGTKESSEVVLDFEISPKDAVAELAKVWQDAVTLKAVYTETRAVSFVNMPIVSFEADTENGIITVTASGENLSEEFFAGTQEASVRLAISDGNSSIMSNFIPVIAEPFAYDPVTNTLTVRTIDDMNLIASYPTASVVIEKTINMSEIDWTPINEFSGNFNGNSDKGYEIKNLSAPLFDTVTGQINNTKISVDITDITENYTGALACTLDGTINNCDVSGKIEVLEMKAQSSSSIHIAGAVGRLLTNATISNVTNNCNVTIRSTEAIETSMDIGGVTSYVSGSNITIKDCCNNGDLTFDVITSTAKSRNLYIGGITAYMPSSVSLTICGNVVNNGDIIFTGNTGVLHMGGISARFQNIVTFSEGCTIGNGGTLTKSGTTKTANVGGVVGWNSSQDVTIAGNIINIGDINIDDTSSTSLSIGGIVGKTVTSVVGAMCYCKINAIGLQGKVGMIAGVTTMASNCAIGGSLVFEQELVEGDFYEEIIKNIETVLTYENYLNYVYASSDATVDECWFLTAKPTMPTI